MKQSHGENPVDVTDESPVAGASSRGKAAKRLSRWSLNLLASSLVLLIALTFGRTLLDWWHADAQETLDPSSVAQLGFASGEMDAGPAVLEFGNSPLTFWRKSFTGDSDAALDQLVKSCAELAKRQSIVFGQPGPAESRLLERLSSQQPVVSDPGAWQVFHHDGPIPMVVGVRSTGLAGNVDESNRCVVSWGIAIQQDKTSWTLLTAAPTDATISHGFQLAETPIPSGAHKTVGLRGVDGSNLIGISGKGSITQWARFYDNWFEEHDWSLQDGWRKLGAGLHSRYVKKDGSQFDVQLMTDGDELFGLLTLLRQHD